MSNKSSENNTQLIITYSKVTTLNVYRSTLAKNKGKIAINPLNLLNKVSENNTQIRIIYTKVTLDVYRSTLKNVGKIPINPIILINK